MAARSERTFSITTSKSGSALIITLADPTPADSGTYVLGGHRFGYPQNLIQIRVTPLVLDVPLTPESVDLTPDEQVRYLKIDTPEDLVHFETGYQDKNSWLEWMYFTAESYNLTNCIACSTARPTLNTIPGPLFPTTDRAGFECMLKLHMTANPINCSALISCFQLQLTTPYHLSSFQRRDVMFV